MIIINIHVRIQVVSDLGQHQQAQTERDHEDDSQNQCVPQLHRFRLLARRVIAGDSHDDLGIIRRCS